MGGACTAHCTCLIFATEGCFYFWRAYVVKITFAKKHPKHDSRVVRIGIKSRAARAFVARKSSFLLKKQSPFCFGIFARPKCVFRFFVLPTVVISGNKVQQKSKQNRFYERYLSEPRAARARRASITWKS